MAIEALAPALRVRGLRPTYKLVLIVLADCAHPDGRNAFPSVETIAERADCSERSVQYALQDLKDRGLIIEQAPATPKRPAVYAVVIEELIKHWGAKSAPPAKRDTKPRHGVQDLHPKRQINRQPVRVHNRNDTETALQPPPTYRPKRPPERLKTIDRTGVEAMISTGTGWQYEHFEQIPGTQTFKILWDKKTSP